MRNLDLPAVGESRTTYAEFRDTVIHGADVVLPDGIIHDASVTIEDGRISSIGRERISRGMDQLDCTGLLVLPGMVDVRCEVLMVFIGIDRRNGLSLESAIREVDRTFASSGITTMYHCLTLSDTDLDLRNRRILDAVPEIIGVMDRITPSLGLQHMVHVTCELSEPAAFPLIEKLFDHGEIDLLSIQDRTPGQGRFEDIEGYRTRVMTANGWNRKAADERILTRLLARSSADIGFVENLAKRVAGAGTPVSTRYNDSFESVLWADSLSAVICDSPLTIAAAREANRRGISIAVEAADLAATPDTCDLLAEGYGDIIYSGSVPNGLLTAAFSLVDRGMRLEDAVNMVGGRLIYAAPSR